MRLLLLIFSLFPSLAIAGPLADSLGISEALGDAKETALTVGSIVILFAVFLSVIPIIIKLVKMVDPRSAMLDQARVSFEGYKKYTTTPSARYGASYKRQSYENPVVDSLYTHAEFLEFSARLHEREAEYFAQQKANAEGTPDEFVFQQEIDEATTRLSELETEKEEIYAQISQFESVEAENDSLFEEDQPESEFEPEIDETEFQAFWESIDDLDRERAA